MKQDVLIYFDLITSLKTTQEVDTFVSEIDNLLLTFFKAEKTPMEKALSSISGNFAQAIIQTCSKNKLDLNDRDTALDFFKTLKELLKKIKVIRLTLAFDPTRKTIEKLHNFVKENIGVGYILDIEISEEILGGAVVMFDGRYFDSSLKKTIKNAFTNKNAEILKLMQ